MHNIAAIKQGKSDMDKICSSLIVFDYVTESKMKEFLYVAKEWGRFLVDRVRISPFGYA